MLPSTRFKTQFHRKTRTGGGGWGLGYNEGNICLSYWWIKFHLTDNSGQMQKNSTPYKESLQTEILQAESISRAIRKAATRLVWGSRREKFILSYIPSDENNRILCKIFLIYSGSTEGLTDIGASFSREPNTSTNNCHWIPWLFTLHISVSIGGSGSDYTMTT